MRCDTCGKPYKPHKKWNSGNPKEILMPECDCYEEATNSVMEAFFERLAKRRQEREG